MNSIKTYLEIKDQIALLSKEEKRCIKVLKDNEKNKAPMLKRLGHQIKLCEVTYKIKALEWVLGKNKYC